MLEVRESVEERARPLGVDVVDVRLRRIDFVPEISESVYRRMEAERKQEANRLRASGFADSESIRAKADRERQDRKSTRLNSSHVAISYAVFCLKKKKL